MVDMLILLNKEDVLRRWSQVRKMRGRVVCLMILLILISCSNSKSSENNINHLNVEIEKTEDKINVEVVKKPIKNKKIESCDCEWKVKKMSHYADLKFSNNRTPFSLDSLNKWKYSPKSLEIKSILLVDFDTIPTEMGVFKNIERIRVRGVNSNNIRGLEVFSKLRIIETEMLWEFDLSNTPKWLEKIEVIHANKTKFIGLNSFKQLPNLRELKISFSGFEPFPKDFISLKCLSHFETGANRFGSIDLKEIDLSKMPCLEYVEFHSWWKNITGIPKGIESVEKIKIHHGNLTKKEKEKEKLKTCGQ